MDFFFSLSTIYSLFVNQKDTNRQAKIVHCKDVEIAPRYMRELKRYSIRQSVHRASRLVSFYTRLHPFSIAEIVAAASSAKSMMNRQTKMLLESGVTEYRSLLTPLRHKHPCFVPGSSRRYARTVARCSDCRCCSSRSVPRTFRRSRPWCGSGERASPTWP